MLWILIGKQCNGIGTWIPKQVTSCPPWSQETIGKEITIVSVTAPQVFSHTYCWRLWNVAYIGYSGLPSGTRGPKETFGKRTHNNLGEGCCYQEYHTSTGIDLV